MSRVEFEPTITAPEWAKTFHALVGGATVIGTNFFFLATALNGPGLLLTHFCTIFGPGNLLCSQHRGL
jgi:hypothetical protein